MKYVFVTGGVVSGLGKGITISSIGRLLKCSGLRTTSIKIDPYLNIDAGTMSPFEHGETFVLNDGGETDLDLGNYERFLDVELTKDHNITTGKIYSAVIESERKGEYLGKTVQVVPHVTQKIQDWITRVSKISVDGSGKEPDVCLVEVGGTVGDIESMVFLEAIRQFQMSLPKNDVCLVHVSLVPVMGTVGEQKTKPTQHGVKELRSAGLFPNMIVCRASEPLLDSTRAKIGKFCHVSPKNVVSVHNVSNIYHVPLILDQQNVLNSLQDVLNIENMKTKPDLVDWTKLALSFDQAKESITLAVVGKYTSLHDAYLSVHKAIRHAAMANDCVVDIVYVDSSDLEPEAEEENKTAAFKALKECDAMIIPGGFGERGVEGKVVAAKYAREEKKPYLGICLGMQVIVVEYARNVLGWTTANSAEVDEKSDPAVVIKMLEHHGGDMGGTMRLGSRATIMDDTKESIVKKLYGDAKEIHERHRHRYEVNPKHIDELEKAGLLFTGKDDKGERMEVTELPRNEHPYYVGTQAHPELKSRPGKPSPFFNGLILAATNKLAKKLGIDEINPVPKRKRTMSKDSGVGDTSSLAPGITDLKKQKVFNS